MWQHELGEGVKRSQVCVPYSMTWLYDTDRMFHSTLDRTAAMQPGAAQLSNAAAAAESEPWEENAQGDLARDIITWP